MNHRQLSSCPEMLSGRALVGLFFALIMLGLPAPRAANAQVINYPNGFANSAGKIWLENSATLSGSSIQLTTNGQPQANNAWYETPVNVQAFTTTFTFAETCPSNCGDGFGFMIISVSNPSSAGYNYSGASSGNLSWSSGCPQNGAPGACTPINSILVKFDLYNDSTNQTGVNFTGFYSGGEYPQPPNPQYDMSGSGINMESGDLMRCTLAYNGTVLTETVTDTVTGATYNNSYTADIPSLVGGHTGYVGFGGGTGAATVVQNLNSWTYTVETPGEAAVPTFSPAAGTYVGSQSVTLSSASSGAVICYNTSGSPVTNGANSCVTGTLYSGPITVSSSETLYAVAGGTGYGDSPVVSSPYVIQSSVAAPSFSPAAGTYNSAQSVTISDAISNAAIYYTTNGTVPTASSTRYAGPVTVSATETLQAIAVANGNLNSPVASAGYIINPVTSVATPIFSPPAGSYTAVQLVTISDTTTGAVIYYTTDGTTPTTSSAVYNGLITVGATETLQAIAVVTGAPLSPVASAVYTLNVLPSVATPAFFPAAGSYTGTQLVTISDTTTGATIYYTTDGTTPTAASPAYTSPIPVSATATLKAIATDTGENNSAVGFAAYNINPVLAVSTPTFTPPTGAYTSAQSVVIADATSGATIYYTTNGTTPTTSSTVYSGPIPVSATETLLALATAPGDTNSAVASAVYTISVSLPVVATPAFTPPAGAYTSAQSVVIADATSGATIYYTTDGTTPTTSSKVYSAPIPVNSTETLEAIAVDIGDANSAVASAAYTITPALPVVATPVFAPVAGTYATPQSVTITDTTSGATIYYTTDGSTPTPSSNPYSGPIAVSSTEMLQAIAVASGDANSAVASAAYTITPLPGFTFAASPATLTVDSSETGTVMLSVTPQNGFNAPVTFVCSGLPAGATCTFAPATVTPAGAAATTQLTISIPAQSAVLPPGSRTFFPLAALALGLFGWRKRYRRNPWLLLVVAFAGLGILTGCGGSGAVTNSSTTSQTATTSTVTVTATSGSLQQMATIVLTVN